MEISGKIIAVLPLQCGVGKNGTEWKKQEYIIQTSDQYPKKCCFTVWGSKIDEFGIQMNQDLDISINIDAREYNGKWYNDIQVWKVIQRNVHQPSQQPQSANQEYKVPKEYQQTFDEDKGKDDLPF